MSYNYNYYQDANYGGAAGLPYGPAPPAGFNVPSMPPANNTPYPQQNYAPYPPSNSGPYPPQNSGPYALPNNGPYPPQNSGPYPPSNHGQYMQNSGPYPPQNNGPYPPQNSGPYPPQNSGPYPPQNSGPYPPQNSGPYAPQNYGQFPLNSGPAPHGGAAVGSYGGSQYGGGPGMGGGVAPSAPPMEQPVHQPQSFHTPTPAPGAPTRPPPPAGGIYPTLSSVAHPAGATAAPAAVPLRQGTVLPFVGFNAESDCMALRKAMKGLGTDERAIIDILCKRSNSQRQELKKLFKTMFGRDLPQDLKSELSGKFEEVILGLMLTPAEYDAKHIRDAIKGAGTDDDALIEILCTRSNAEIEQIKTVYKTLYKSDMEKDLKSDTSGDFMRLVVALSAGGRMESQAVNVQRAKEDATAGKARIGTDEATFTKIFCLQSHAQLCATFDEYRAIAGCTIEQTLDSELSGNFCRGLHTIAKVARNKPGYFAERLYLSMKGAGTNDRVLMRVVVTRCEVDMVQIKQEFQTKYHKTLDSFIDGDTSGDYKKALLALIR